ncbi:MAG TPA: 5-dehydro-2-deoxygluconokinase [Beijerinckiaceae bacterium]|nr:5-dehydro-2-deoxygluconokinase [Beijerinckiaceae bacterium]
MTAELDVVAIGRSSVDLYGQQIGGRLEDMASFAKSVGGSPTNTAIGAARLGLRAALITAVGDEHMGRFIREQLEREGVDTRGVKTDPKRLTGLVLLGVQDDKSFPLIFYRENCADMALTEADVDEALVASAKAVCISGTHLSTPGTYAMTRKAVRAAKAAGRRVVWDVDYRPNLWGLAGHGAGEARYIGSDTVTAHLQTVAPDCDLIVGTEEEFHILGGSPDTIAALRAVRAISAATLVCKRGPMGCAVFPGPIPNSLDEGIRGPGFPVEVYNVLGAGDAFMAGFLRGWLRDEPLETCCAWANACGAFAVSRLLCSPEYPTWPELQHFLKHGATDKALRRDPALSQIHWATTRRPAAPTLRALAVDHRTQLEALADRLGAPRASIAAFKRLAVRAAAAVADGRPGYGVLVDGTHGREALFDAAAAGLWIGRPIEKAGSRPLAFEWPDLGSHLAEWPATHTAKCLCFWHPDDPDDLRARQEAALLSAFDACRTAGRELMIEIVASKHGPIEAATTARALERLYRLGIKPDWWKLEAQPAGGWAAVEAAIASGDPHCRGVLVLGLDAPEAAMIDALAQAAASPVVKGFAIGRTIFGEAAESWLAGAVDDAAAVAEMAARFRRLCQAWDEAARARAA